MTTDLRERFERYYAWCMGVDGPLRMKAIGDFIDIELQRTREETLLPLKFHPPITQEEIAQSAAMTLAYNMGREETLKEVLGVVEKLRAAPTCYCKTHPEHNCGITSNETIDDVFAAIKGLRKEE